MPSRQRESCSASRAPPASPDAPGTGPRTAASQPPPVTRAAARQPMKEASASEPSDSASPGSSQAAAAGAPEAGSSRPVRVSSGTLTARTATVRMSASRSPPPGVAAAISCSGSACGP